MCKNQNKLSQIIFTVNVIRWLAEDVNKKKLIANRIHNSFDVFITMYTGFKSFFPFKKYFKQKLSIILQKFQLPLNGS